MLSKIIDFVSQRGYNKEVERLRKKVVQINAIEEGLQSLTDEQLQAKTAEFKAIIRGELDLYEAEVQKVQDKLEGIDDGAVSGEQNPPTPFTKGGDTGPTANSQPQILSDEERKAFSNELVEKKAVLKKKEQEVLDRLMLEVFAVHKNACRRLVGKTTTVRGHETVWNMIPFDVQLMGGIILHEGKIAEMKTGEGKTLVATLPLYLNALVGRGAHLVTVNDYLAQRDSEWNALLFHFLGMSVGVILNGFGHDAKREAYHSDITYGTNNEFGFDYLRDNMSTNVEQEVQRELHYAIVDEVDSILVDEARTPLIISAPAEESTGKYLQYSQYVKQLVRDTHYVLDEKLKTASLTEAGIKKMEELMHVENIYTDAGFTEVHHIEQALKAQACYQNEVDYLVKDGEVLIVDEFTGRILAGRRYSDGLHQAIEAKEGVEIKRESRTLATITFQNYFRLFDKLAGMTGTALTEAEEFSKIYGLDVVPIPTNRPMTRTDLSDTIYKTEAGKFNAIAEKVKEKNAKGQPVLIGTIAIEKSEALSRMLKLKGVSHSVLNAKYHEQEAEIVANAGQKGVVTIATNMAGRGTDIKLGEGVAELGGLAILGSERHESRRIDNQLRGRAGRQGDAGETQFYISLDDNLMRIFGGDRIRKMMEMLKIPEDMPIENGMISSSIEGAQKRVEGHHFDTRKHVVEYDDVMNKQREIIYSRRKKILHKQSVYGDILSMIQNLANRTAAHLMLVKESMDSEQLEREIALLPISPDIVSVETIEGFVDLFACEQYLSDVLLSEYKKKEAALPDPSIMRNAERFISLRSIDTLWMEHLDTMQSLRDAVGLHGYGQKDPLVEYKKAGFASFEKLLNSIDHETLQTLFRAEFMPENVQQMATEVAQPIKVFTNQDAIEGGLREDFSSNNNPAPHIAGTASNNGPEVGRNELCPCGSRKKFKKCHGANS